ncbi:MAG: DPP IV N-terminal domain-containing protein, partial [Acidobacteria bacterium]|nr:DPP IV N-terminal domain-containing protein [Acidobacteriota bacterium]
MKQRLYLGSPSILVLVVLATLVAAPAVLAQPAFDQVMGLDLKPRQAQNQAWDPAGTRLAFLYDPGDGTRLEVANAAGGRLEPWLRAGSDGAPESLDAFAWSPDGRRLAVIGDDDVFLWEIGTRTLTRLTTTDAKEADPKFSPDGRWLAYVRDQDLVIADLAAGTERALTSDGKDGEVYNGKTDWVYWEEIWGR